MPVKLATALWVLSCARRDLVIADTVLDQYFDEIPVPKRVELQLARADLEWVIEQVMEKICVKSKVRN